MSETTTKSTALRCIVVTPEETVLEVDADYVALPLYDGEIGIALHHSPMIGRMGCGELRIRTGSETKSYYVDGGFVQVSDNVVSLLTNRALPAADVDVEVVQEQLQTALSQPAKGDEELAVRDRLVTQARAQVRVARRPK